MPDEDDIEMTDAPATWENIVHGEVEELVGKVTGDKALVEEGKDEVEVAHEVREEWREQKEKRHPGE